MATTTYLIDPPKSYVLPVTLECDRVIIVRRKDSEGEPLNWGTITVHMAIDIDKDDPTVVDANITDDEAELHIEESVCDLIKKGTRWRIWSDDSGVRTPLLVGKIERSDGG